MRMVHQVAPGAAAGSWPRRREPRTPIARRRTRRPSRSPSCWSTSRDDGAAPLDRRRGRPFMVLITVRLTVGAGPQVLVDLLPVDDAACEVVLRLRVVREHLRLEPRVLAVPVHLDHLADEAPRPRSRAASSSAAAAAAPPPSPPPPPPRIGRRARARAECRCTSSLWAGDGAPTAAAARRRAALFRLALRLLDHEASFTASVGGEPRAADDAAAGGV